VTARRVLVLGGARSGKSAHAEALLAAEPAVDYVATAPLDASDAEWVARVDRHRQRRPGSWTTVETQDLAGVLAAPGCAALVDSVTAWLTAAIDAASAWEGSAETLAALDAEVDAVVTAWTHTPRRVVAVSDEVGGGIVPDSTSGRLFRDALGLLNQRLAAAADEVWLVTAGIAQQLR
jgi:adenosylcobinamide kinase/adenosylcobinamide-phosphate guanylyltransferase